MSNLYPKITFKLCRQLTPIFPFWSENQNNPLGTDRHGILCPSQLDYKNRETFEGLLAPSIHLCFYCPYSQSGRYFRQFYIYSCHPQNSSRMQQNKRLYLHQSLWLYSLQVFSGFPSRYPSTFLNTIPALLSMDSWEIKAWWGVSRVFLAWSRG